MTTSPDPQARRRFIALIATGAAVLAFAGLGAYGLLTGPRDTTPEPSPTAAQTTPEPSTRTGSPGPTPRNPTIPQGTDSEVFARNVASALFAWDTGSGLMPLDYTAVVLDVGDPTGVEQAGLASDVAAYLPIRQAWIELRRYATTQHLTIDRLYIPDAWDDAITRARPGQLPPGALAYTIEGIRHRDGVWNEQPSTAEHEVTFTMFIACPPEGDPCYLLRLSQLNNPLR